MVPSDMGSTELREKPRVSVIIPTNNRARLLQEALDSVYAQEGLGEQFEMEVIVVEDAFAEATAEVMGRYPGARYLQNETPPGASAARNTGIRASTGKYVAFLDDDDLCLPHRLKVHVPVLEANPEVGVVYGQLIVKGDGEETLWPEAHRAPSGSAFRAMLMEEFMHPSQVMIRRQAFEKAGSFDETLRTMEHYDLSLRLAFHVPFVFIRGPIAIGRFSEQGKWFTNIQAGGYEHNVPRILERALALPPDTADRAELRRQAYISWFSQIAYWLERAGGADRVHRHVLAVLEKHPWMVTEPLARASVEGSAGKVARALALASDSPITAVQAFCAEAKAATGGGGLKEWLGRQRMLANIWARVAATLVETGSPQHRWAARYAVACAVLHDPAQLRRKTALKPLVRAFLASPRWEPIIAALKRIVG